MDNRTTPATTPVTHTPVTTIPVTTTDAAPASRGGPLAGVLDRLPSWAVTAGGLALTAAAARGSLLRRVVLGLAGTALTAAAASRAAEHEKRTGRKLR